MEHLDNSALIRTSRHISTIFNILIILLKLEHREISVENPTLTLKKRKTPINVIRMVLIRNQILVELV